MVYLSTCSCVRVCLCVCARARVRVHNTSMFMRVTDTHRYETVGRKRILTVSLILLLMHYSQKNEYSSIT